MADGGRSSEQSSGQPGYAKTQDSSAGSAWKSPWVIGWLGLIVVVLGVNITMVVLAITTNPGLIRADYYERGRDVEQTIVTRLESGPGWVTQIDTPADTTAGIETTVRFFVVDSVGQPVNPDEVVYYAYRPSDATRDFSVPMTAGGGGRYEVDIVFPLGGIWDTVVSVRHEGDEHSVAQRVSVGQPLAASEP
jgi:nitrogen fixation protein FixH